MPQPIKKNDRTSAAPAANALPMQTRAASVTSVNEDARTIELVWTTGAKVRRYDWWREEPFDEELIVTPDACDLSRLNNGAPLLEQHRAWSLDGVLGVVERAWIANGEGRATVRFSRAEDSPDADRVFRQIKDKIIRNVSVGYSIRKVERERRETGVAVWRVVDWQPNEISVVAIGADDKAGFRADEGAQTFPFILVDRAAPENQETLMEEDENVPAAGAVETRANPPPANPANPAAPAVPAIGERTAEHSWAAGDIARVNARAAAFGLTAADAIVVMGETRSVDAATDALQARAASRAAPRQTPQAQVIRDEGDTIRAAIENAVLHRAAPTSVQLDVAARQWRGMSLLEMGRAFLEETQGVRLRGLSKQELASILLGLDGQRAGMHSTSDFANLLANVASKRLRNGYGTARQTWRAFCRQSNAPDFKERAIVQLAGMPELRPIREGGEYTHAYFSDSVEKYAIGTFGRKIAITRQTLINDDLGAFDRLPTIFGRAAAEFESDAIYKILLDNPVMGDGIALFHASRGNLLAAGVPNEPTLEAAEIALGAQLDAAGKPLNLQAKYLLVSRKHKVAGQKILRSVTATKTGDINVYENSMELIVEDRLYSAAGLSPWFIIADPAQWDTIEYAYLEGEEGLYTEQRVGFDVDGIEIKGRLDFGAKAIDHKAFQRNPGT